MNEQLTPSDLSEGRLAYPSTDPVSLATPIARHIVDPDATLDETVAQLGKKDFVVSSEAGYAYPFSPSSVETGSAEWCEPAFNMGEVAKTLPGPVVELGGPTTKGFRSLAGVYFSERPLITNVGGENSLKLGPDGKYTLTEGSYSLNAMDILTLDALVDMRQLPFRDASLGVILVADAPNSTEEANVQSLNGIDSEAVQEASLKQTDDVYDSLLSKFDALDEQSLKEQSELSQNPAIGMIFEAKRTLTGGGLLVIKNADPKLQILAVKLGFNVKMQFSKEYGGNGEDILDPEVVLQKPL